MKRELSKKQLLANKHNLAKANDKIRYIPYLLGAFTVLIFYIADKFFN